MNSLKIIHSFFIFSFLCILLVSIPSIAQNTRELTCHYTLQARLDSNNTRYTNTEKFSLVRKGSTSVFRSVNGYIRDSMMFAGIKGGSEVADMNRAKAPRTKFSDVIIKKQNEIYTYDNIYTSRYYYKEEDKLAWKIHHDFKSVGEIKCQKATTTFAGRKYEAWFSKEISVSDGPYKFSGLPGLIIQIYDIEKDYIFTLTSIIDKAPDIKEPYANSKYLDKKSFVKLYNNFTKNAIDILNARGKNYGNSLETKRNYEAMLKKENNPIELKP
jgi:GLPGLI family protein